MCERFLLVCMRGFQSCVCVPTASIVFVRGKFACVRGKFACVRGKLVCVRGEFEF